MKPLSTTCHRDSLTTHALNRLTSSPLGSYSYGDSAHLHAATAAGSSSYTASYDAAGGMTCRATSGATTCAGTPTGAQLVYDAERRLKHWQDKQSSPTATDDYLYDGAGQRIQKQSVSGATTTVTSYIGGIEEAQTVNGGAVTLTKYLGAPGMPMAIRVGTSGTLSYLASDGLSSMSEALDSSGNVTAQQLYAPYGGSRYSNGTMPTSKGFTGQRADSGSSGLDYYGARYYDPLLGQFASADTVADGLNRYGYVHGNPTTFSDPSGHMPCDMTCNTGGGSSEVSEYDDPEMHIHLRGRGCGAVAGCVDVKARNATIGPGKQVQKGDDSTPSKYTWGDDKQGATATGYSGKNLDMLIELDKVMREWMQGHSDWLDKNGDPIVDAISEAVAYIITYVGGFPEGAPELGKNLANLVGTAITVFVGAILSHGIDELNAGIAGLETAAHLGETVWYVGFTWHGRYRQDQVTGLSGFYTSSTRAPNNTVLYAVALGLMQQCQLNVPSRGDGSPGLTRDQTHSATEC